MKKKISKKELAVLVQRAFSPEKFIERKKEDEFFKQYEQELKSLLEKNLIHWCESDYLIEYKWLFWRATEKRYTLFFTADGADLYRTLVVEALFKEQP